MTNFRDRIDAAIESHQRLDTPEFRQESTTADLDDLCYWQGQLRLDAAIAMWRQNEPRGRRTAAVVRRLAATIAVTAAGIAAGWLGRPAEQAPFVDGSIAVAAMANDEVVGPRRVDPDDGVLLAHLENDQYAQAAATAGRLAYAFEPVGERVETVVRFLVDAVPGSNVFAM